MTDRRTDEEIRADLATAAPQQPPAIPNDARSRLVADVAPLLAEVAALRTENETLTAHIAVLDDDADAALDVRDEAIEAESQAGDRIAAELAAERAQHETTRAAVLASVGNPDALDEALCDAYPDAKGFHVGQVTEVVIGMTRAALAAASPSPVAGQEAGT